MKCYRTKKMIGLGFVFAVSGILAGCSTGEPSGDLMADYRRTDLTIGGDGNVENPGENSVPVTVSGGGERLYEDGTLAINDFSVRLMKECFENNKNVLISPLSVISALGMTANGAKGTTLSQMESVFRMDIPNLNTFLKEYRENLPDGEKYKMNLANGIWFRDSEGFAVNEAFLQTNADYYNAGLYKAPFDHTTKEEINGWVKQNTDGMIQDILNEVPKDAMMYLVNALAFDGEWQTIYKESRVRDGEFQTENGVKQNITMMYSDEKVYLEDEKVQGFCKYYADKKYCETHFYNYDCCVMFLL